MIDNKHKYWWVSHTKTYKFQIEGNHLWSPKQTKNGRQEYTNMTKVNSGDMVLSYANQKISHIGIATGGVISQLRPQEYREDWNSEGFMVPVSFYKLDQPITIDALNKQFEKISILLPSKFSPLVVKERNGKKVLGGRQSYLSEISEELAKELFKMTSQGSVERITTNHLAPQEKSNNDEKIATQSSADELMNKIVGERSNKKNTKSKKNKQPATSPPTPQHDRSQFVKEYVYKRANGKCELCSNNAPFETGKKTENRRPFLESHHIVWLSKKGDDTIENSVALCPNCHRKMHHNSNTNEVEKDFQFLSELYKFISHDHEKKYTNHKH
jgi:5-methylcytosine-specific restriction endonuclease McrA